MWDQLCNINQKLSLSRSTYERLQGLGRCAKHQAENAFDNKESEAEEQQQSYTPQEIELLQMALLQEISQLENSKLFLENALSESVINHMVDSSGSSVDEISENSAHQIDSLGGEDERANSVFKRRRVEPSDHEIEETANTQNE